MADFLTINEFAFPVADGNASADDTVIGDEGRAFPGTAISDSRDFKDEWSLQTPLVSVSEIDAHVALIQGRGHHWSFDSATDWHFSSKGLNVDSETGATHMTAAPAPKFGEGWIQLAAATQIEWQGGTRFTDQWTLMVWKHNGASWESFIKLDDGTVYTDGILGGAALFLDIDSTGGIQLGDPAAGGTQDFDDLVALPYRITPSMALAFGTATLAFSDLPRLTMDGTIVNDRPKTVLGTAGSRTFLQGRDNVLAAHSPALQTFAFVLSEA